MKSHGARVALDFSIGISLASQFAFVRMEFTQKKRPETLLKP